MNTHSCTATTEEMVTLAHRMKRAAEMSAGIMRDAKRTGGWAGSENTARAFERLSEQAATLHGMLSARATDSAGVPGGLVERERLARAMYDSHPHIAISPAIAEATGLPMGEILTWDVAVKAGADMSPLLRYADAVIAALSARPSPPKVDATIPGAKEHLLALAALIERPPLDDVLINKDVALQAAAAIRTVFASSPDGKCPRCSSPSPAKHPAVQYGGEVQICPHEYHASPTRGAEDTQAEVVRLIETADYAIAQYRALWLGKAVRDLAEGQGAYEAARAALQGEGINNG